MARATKQEQKVENVKQPKTSKVNQQAKFSRREPSQKELFLSKLGMIFVLAIVLGVGLYFGISAILQKKDKSPFEDAAHLTTTEVVEIFKNNQDGTYGNYAFFENNEDYAVKAIKRCISTSLNLHHKMKRFKKLLRNLLILIESFSLLIWIKRQTQSFYKTLDFLM